MSYFPAYFFTSPSTTGRIVMHEGHVSVANSYTFGRAGVPLLGVMAWPFEADDVLSIYPVGYP